MLGGGEDTPWVREGGPDRTCTQLSLSWRDPLVMVMVMVMMVMVMVMVMVVVVVVVMVVMMVVVLFFFFSFSNLRHPPRSQRHQNYWGPRAPHARVSVTHCTCSVISAASGLRTHRHGLVTAHSSSR